jgi:hypothetical protein
MAVFWVVAPCSPVEVYRRFRGPCYQTTRRYNPEDSHLRTHRRENLKSYLVILSVSRIMEPERTNPLSASHRPVKQSTNLIIISESNIDLQYQN